MKGLVAGFTVAAFGLCGPPLRGADDKDDLAAAIDARRADYAALAKQIWGLAEVGYREEKSAALLVARLQKAGFKVERGVAGMPTAFVATYGQGPPVVAFLAEYDALPGLSQEAVPERKPLGDGAPGHGCGHHLLGTGSTAAAIATKEWLARAGRPGTVKLYGTPAEEGGGGKIYMVRAGLFDGVDAVLSWHPSDANDAGPKGTLANTSAKFRFHGIASHAAGAPERGRSALDGVEALDFMVNMMREHVPSEARIHYVITRGGAAPNVVPDFAEVYYYARHPSVPVLDAIWERIGKAAEGAAMGTGTRVEQEIVNAVYSMLPSQKLHELADANMRRVGGYGYSPEEQAFAERLYATLVEPDRALGSQAAVAPFRPHAAGGSTDVADVSWVVPTADVEAATWVPGTSAHSWQATACGGTSIGVKGMLVAAKTLSMTALDLYSDPALLQAARRDWEEKRGAGFVYRPRVGDRKPPLDYRR
jgi:aminobenzoyl-glutamate utilization protein B